MKKLFALVLALILVAAVVSTPVVLANPFGVIQGGGGTTNASDLTSGTVAVARGGTGAGTAANARTNLGLGTSDNVTFGVVTGSQFVSSGADNTHTGNVSNTADPTGFSAGDYWFNKTTNLWKVRNGDNTATITLNDVQWHRINIDAPTTTDNMMFAGPLERAQTIDNVVFIVQDNTGKLSGASTDNVTVNIIYCGAADNTVAQCTKVFTSDQTATGAAVLSPAMNNTAPAAGNYLRFYVAAANMTNKKLYIRIKYRSL